MSCAIVSSNDADQMQGKIGFIACAYIIFCRSIYFVDQIFQNLFLYTNKQNKFKNYINTSNKSKKCNSITSYC